MTSPTETETAAAQASVRPGSEAWSSAGHGEHAKTGLLLVHGFTGSPASLRPLAEMLARRGYAVELLRLPGHGTHFREMLPTRYDDWREAVIAGAKALAARTERIVFVGLSLGGTLSLDAATSGTNPAGVVTINAQILNREGLAVRLAPLIERLLPIVPPKLAGLTPNDIAKPRTEEQAYGWVPTAAGNSILRALSRVRGQLETLSCPVLVMYSRNDHSVPPENSRALLKLIDPKLTEELVLERSYHVATLDYDLELIEERVAQFADRIAGAN
jgi:carboxylesterase